MNTPRVCRITEFPQKRYLDTLRKNGFVITPYAKDWDVFLPNYGNFAEEMAGITDASGRYVMGIPGTPAITHRKNVWVNLVKAYGRKASSKIMPETFLLDHAPDLERMKLLPPKTPFILKTTLHQRMGLKVVDSTEEAIANQADYIIAQPVIEDLYKFKGTPLNFRSYLLLNITGRVLTAYIFYESTCIYGLPPADQTTRFQKAVTHSANPIPDGFPFLLSEFCELENIDYAEFLMQLSNKIVLMLESASGAFGNLQNLSQANCFQIYGLDVLLQHDKTPLICEVNKAPSMSARNEVSAELKDQLLNDALSLVGIFKADNVGFIKILESHLIP